jgi:hypothetical protein
MNDYRPQLSALLVLLLLSLYAGCASAETLVFSCTRVERDYQESYELQVRASASNVGVQKGKVYLDGRDLDRSGSDGNQMIKNVVISKDRVSYLSDTHFEAEVFDGISYPPANVITVVTIDRHSGKLRRVETISGGILALSLGEGARSYEEQCTPINRL